MRSFDSFRFSIRRLERAVHGPRTRHLEARLVDVDLAFELELGDVVRFAHLVHGLVVDTSRENAQPSSDQQVIPRRVTSAGQRAPRAMSRRNTCCYSKHRSRGQAVRERQWEHSG